MKSVISLGGSLIYPDTIDLPFLNSFREFVISYIEKGHSFIIICGGGMLARNFQQASPGCSDEEKDWLGIMATKLNAHLLKSLFKQAHNKIIDNPTETLPESNLIIASGWKPGFSTDYDAVILAKAVGAESVINMSNIEHVYDSDPKHNPDARPHKEMSWTAFREMVGSKWVPGLNLPFDPIAAKEAHESNIQLIVVGKNLDNLKKVLDKKEFKGTIIK